MRLCHVAMCTARAALVLGLSVFGTAAALAQAFDPGVRHASTDKGTPPGLGIRLADRVTQGAAGPDEFRSAPLWGVGQRVFFLHDGRTTNLIQAIRLHASEGSEANRVVDDFFDLSTAEQQDLINFLRSL